MAITVILEGTNGIGKTSVCEKLEIWLKSLSVNYTYFHDTDIFESVLDENNLFDIDDIINERRDLYREMREEYDVILLDRSFMSTIIYNLTTMSNEAVDNYVFKELLNLRPFPSDKLLTFVLINDCEDERSNEYVELSHYLLLNFHTQSRVWHTHGDLERTFNVIKDDIFTELKHDEII